MGGGVCTVCGCLLVTRTAAAKQSVANVGPVRGSGPGRHVVTSRVPGCDVIIASRQNAPPGSQIVDYHYYLYLSQFIYLE
ncbi:hypothetical protein E2C01_073735 [Portunus trituberculatus]|uniref:Secreted protein n=1 Tax=Portunus trituberculatus TaxID=210409 RepID=A0A5B7IBC6_PORTR|nr:hypothetical protein [Portunus trituberculatus]